jgi:hypothetical protein
MDITYLSHLDYIDIKHVCESDEKLNYICKDDKIIRNILYSKSNLISIPLDINIIEVLDVFYKSFEDYFNDLPRWVNFKQFKDDHIRYMIGYCIDSLPDLILDHSDFDLDDIYIEDSVWLTGNINYPLIGYQADTNDIPSVNIDITPLLKDYIMPTIKNVIKKYDMKNYVHWDLWRELYHVIEILTLYKE